MVLLPARNRASCPLTATASGRCLSVTCSAVLSIMVSGTTEPNAERVPLHADLRQPRQQRRRRQGHRAAPGIDAAQQP